MLFAKPKKAFRHANYPTNSACVPGRWHIAQQAENIPEGGYFLDPPTEHGVNILVQLDDLEAILEIAEDGMLTFKYEAGSEGVWCEFHNLSEVGQPFQHLFSGGLVCLAIVLDEYPYVADFISPEMFDAPNVRDPVDH